MDTDHSKRPAESRHGEADAHEDPAGEPPTHASSVPRDADRTSVSPDPDRRSGEERRVEHDPVAEDRRLETRRLADRQAAAREARAERRHAVVDRVTLGVDYLFYLLYGLLGIRFLLAALGASEGAGFVRFVQGITDPFYAPFRGIVGRPAIEGGYLDFPLVIAVLAYILLHVAMRGMLRLIAGDRTVP